MTTHPQPGVGIGIPGHPTTGQVSAYASRAENRPAWSGPPDRTPYGQQEEPRPRTERDVEAARILLLNPAGARIRGEAFAELLAARQYRDEAPVRAAREAADRAENVRREAAHVFADVLLGHPATERAPEDTTTESTETPAKEN